MPNKEENVNVKTIWLTSPMLIVRHKSLHPAINCKQYAQSTMAAYRSPIALPYSYLPTFLGFYAIK